VAEGKTETLNANWDNKPDAYDQVRRTWLNQRRLSFLQAEVIGVLSGKLRVLEIGSGTGFLLNDLAKSRPDCEFVGIDPNQSYIDYAEVQARMRRLANVTYHCVAGERLTHAFGDARLFDLVLSNDVLHHVSDLEQVFAETASHARSGCRWIAIEPNPLNPYVFLGQLKKTGEKNFSPRDARVAAQSVGWTYASASFLFLIPPFIRRPHAWLRKIEASFEHVPFLAGGIVQMYRIKSPYIESKLRTSNP